jgi:hypothetical protein
MASKKRALFRIQPHDGIDKWFEIEGPDGFLLRVDYDDVDHQYVDRVALAMVGVLNEHQEAFAKADDWHTPFDEEDEG